MAQSRYTGKVAIQVWRNSIFLQNTSLYLLPSLLLSLLLLKPISSSAQTYKYFIEFKDKANSPFSLNRPIEFLSQRSLDRRAKQKITLTEKDLPVNPAYVQGIKQTGAKVWYTSRWMNAALVEADAASITKIKNLPFVKPVAELQALERLSLPDKPLPERKKSTSHLSHKRTADPISNSYGFSRNQLVMLGVDQMHTSGLDGQGLHIAVLDGGFSNADKIPSLRHLFLNNQILGTYDFVEAEQSVFEDYQHGMQVLSVLAGRQEDNLFGPAYKAHYWLLRTEDDNSEYRIEEVNWLIGAEFADSAGVDIINSSLGYNTFDDSSMDYQQSDMNGNTTLVTRAADIAVATGMLVVVSAGNEGDNSWGTITAPGDADSVLTVGAVTDNGLYASFSSRGPSADRRIKPNVTAQGQSTVLSRSDGSIGTSNGTSFSTPLIAGLAAGFWQAFPTLTPLEIIDYLQRSANQSTKPDSLIGYGIPNFTHAAQLVEIERGTDKQNGLPFPNPVNSDEIILRLNISHLGQPLNLQFYDPVGRKIQTLSINQPTSENRIPLNPGLFRNGLYILRISSPSWQMESKFVVL